MTTPNVDAAEVAKFSALASRWWDKDGEFRPLHDINPARVAYIAEHCSPAGKRVLDVGCGGGILSEALSRLGGDVTGLDAGDAPLAVARLHAEQHSLPIRYLATTAEALAIEEPATYDLVTCMETLEHVPDPGLLVAACAALAKPGGTLVFSTINRNPKAYALTVIGAEYVLGLLPRGTHDYRKFLKPSELAASVRAAGLSVIDVSGMRYNPFTRECSISRDTDVNYQLVARKALAPRTSAEIAALAPRTSAETAALAPRTRAREES
jgi:2-polyprenyl-6-hydroxyphenyl methylase/3-demethylubiquinone-9 3-methyltransferase